ncbi:MAG: TfoX/Sxy family protein [Paracoccaceae bacterium]
MSLSDSDIAFALELFAPLGGISHRKMMGGLSIYHDGQIFSLVNRDGTIFLKATGGFAQIMKAAGSRQFAAGKGRVMGYWTMPDDALDDAATACDWARRALEHL